MIEKDINYLLYKKLSNENINTLLSRLINTEILNEDEMKDIKDYLELSNSYNLDEQTLENLVLLYQQNDSEIIFNKIYKFYIPKFKYYAYKMKSEDYVQELSIALMKAIETYQQNAGAKFNTYFWNIMKNHIGGLKSRNNAIKRMPELKNWSLQATIQQNDDEVSLEDAIEDTRVTNEFDDMMLNIFLEQEIYSKLTSLNAAILQLYLNGYSYQEMSDIIGVSPTNIYTRLKKIKKAPIVYDTLAKYFADKGIDVRNPVKRKKIKKIQQKSNLNDIIQAKVNYKPPQDMLVIHSDN